MVRQILAIALLSVVSGCVTSEVRAPNGATAVRLSRVQPSVQTAERETSRPRPPVILGAAY